MAGFAQGGGVGLALAQWMVNGEPDGDVYALDVARALVSTPLPAMSRKRPAEFYARRFRIAYPNEYWPAARPYKTSAIHDCLAGENAVFGVSYGLEIPLFLAELGKPAAETPSLRRSDAFEQVAKECSAVRSAVAVLDISSFGKYEVRGTSTLKHSIVFSLDGSRRQAEYA